MPAPYSFPTDRVTGGPAPADDVNALGAALNEADAAATASVLMLRDAAGRTKVATPAAAEDAANKDYVDVAVAGAGGGGVVPVLMPNATARWLHPVTRDDYANGASAYATATVQISPLVIGAPLSIDALGCNVTTLEAVEVRLFLYESDGEGYPTNLVATATATPVGTGALIMVLGAPVVLDPGIYWTAIRTSGGSTIRFRAMSLTSAAVALSALPSTTVVGNRPYLLEGDVGVFVTPNDPIGAVGFRNDGTNLFPMVAVRRAP
jgi:hypothetical protein